MNTYKVYENGELIGSNLNCREVHKLIGIPTKAISHYSSTGNTYIGRYTIVKDGEHGMDITIKPEIKNGWNEMMAAARLLKTGKGKIVTKNGKKYVEVK